MAKTELQDGTSLCLTGWGAGLLTKGDEMWINPTTADHHRIIKTVSNSDRRIYVTTDKWVTINSPSNIATVSTAAVLWHALASAVEDSDYLMFGRGSGAASVNPVWMMDGETAVNAWQAAGANTSVAPYTDAIPTVASAYVAEDGIFVGEAPASSGISVYSVEHNAFDTAHTPLKGDRASWRDMDADLDGSSVPFADYHAEDIYEDTPQRHNPWPASSGYAPVSDGSKYVVPNAWHSPQLSAHLRHKRE